MVEGTKQFTRGGDLKRPGIAIVCGWVKTARDNIPKVLVQKAFSEDDKLYRDLVCSTAVCHELFSL